jgi:two-component system, OmpR family, alkaline phosphatase synthesis response regulator PhoP
MALIYYVEDDQAISYIIQKTIENAKLDSKGFNKGEDFLFAFKNQKPDMVLIDIMLPDISGIELLKIIRKTDKKIPIMVISALQNEMDKVIALDNGADDYMTKPFGILELTSRIRSKIRKIERENTIKHHNVEIDIKKHQFTIQDEIIYLTHKEFAIMALLLKNKGQVVTKEEIFKDVWETDYIGETRTLDMHIKALREKLKTNQATVSILTMRGIGYIIQ